MITFELFYYRLQDLANAVMNYFIMKGLGKDEYGRVKLHATVINTKLRETDQGESTTSLQSRNNKKAAHFSRTSFDAREVTEVCLFFIARCKE